MTRIRTMAVHVGNEAEHILLGIGMNALGARLNKFYKG